MSDDERRNDEEFEDDDFESEDDDGIESDIPDWLSEVAPIGGDADDDGDDDSEDWLSELSEADVELEFDADPEAGATTDSPDWMADEPTAAEAGVPDWLAEMTPPETVDVYAVVNSPDYGVIDDEDADDLFALEEDVSPEEVNALDWMAMADDDEGGEFIEGNIELDDDVLVPGDVPDWLSEMQGETADDLEPMPLEAAGGDILAPNADTPDWLSEIQDDAAEELDELEPVPFASQGGEGIVPDEESPDWLAEETYTDEEPVPVGEMPDWLSDASPDELDEVEGIEVPETEAAVPEWLSEPTSEVTEIPPDAAETLEPVPGWLEEDADTLEPAQEGGYAAVPEAGFEPVEAEPVEPVVEAAAMPDWLSEAAPEAEPELVLEEEIAEFETEAGELEPVILVDEGDQAEFIEEEVLGETEPAEVPLVASIEAPPMPEAMPEAIPAGIPEVAAGVGVGVALEEEPGAEETAAAVTEPETEFVYIETVQPGEPVETPETYVAAETLPDELAEEAAFFIPTSPDLIPESSPAGAYASVSSTETEPVPVPVTPGVLMDDEGIEDEEEERKFGLVWLLGLGAVAVLAIILWLTSVANLSTSDENQRTFETRAAQVMNEAQSTIIAYEGTATAGFDSQAAPIVGVPATDYSVAVNALSTVQAQAHAYEATLTAVAGAPDDGQSADEQNAMATTLASMQAQINGYETAIASTPEPGVGAVDAGELATVQAQSDAYATALAEAEAQTNNAIASESAEAGSDTDPDAQATIALLQSQADSYGTELAAVRAQATSAAVAQAATASADQASAQSLEATTAAIMVMATASQSAIQTQSAAAATPIPISGQATEVPASVTASGLTPADVCREGIENDADPAATLAACEAAVAQNPTDGPIRDSRGIARVLNGDFEGAIEDFTFFIQWSRANGLYESAGVEREGWIVALQAGRNPFVFEGETPPPDSVDLNPSLGRVFEDLGILRPPWIRDLGILPTPVR